MSLLKNLKMDSSIQEEKDSLGSSLLDSGVYDCKVITAYLSQASSGALSLVVNFKTTTDKSFRQTFWLTSGKEKGSQNFYLNKSGEKKYLPGFILGNHLTQLTLGKPISEVGTETKVINLYSSEAKKEVPTSVAMVMDLLNKEIKVAVLKQLVNKTSKNTTTGAYEATNEIKEENEVVKFFRASDSFTISEIDNNATEATFITEWRKKWDNKINNKVKAVSGKPNIPARPATKSDNILFT